MVAFGQIFSPDTQAIFFNWKANPVQRMLDFDFLCGMLFLWSQPFLHFLPFSLTLAQQERRHKYIDFSADYQHGWLASAIALLVLCTVLACLLEFSFT